MQEVKETFKFPKILAILFVVQFAFFIIYFLNNEEDRTLLLFSIVIFVIGVILAFAKFHLYIGNNGISYSLFPFTSKVIQWKDVKNCEINKISALDDFSGWGIRYSKKYGWGYIFDSSYALSVFNTNGRRITFSIKDKKAIEKIVKKNKLP
jgi:hypothetical protein